MVGEFRVQAAFLKNSRPMRWITPSMAVEENPDVISLKPESRTAAYYRLGTTAYFIERN